MSGPPDDRWGTPGGGSNDGGSNDYESNNSTYSGGVVGRATRRSVLGSLAGAFVTMGLSGQATALDREPGITTVPGRNEDRQWPAYGRDPRRGATADPTSQHCLPDTLEEQWQSKALEQGVESVWAPRNDDYPVYAWGATIQDGSWDGYIYGLDRDTGGVLWGPIRRSGIIWLNPTAGDDLRYYAVDDLETPVSIHALDAETGADVWDTEMSFTQAYPSPNYNSSTDTVCALGTAGQLVALDGSDGSPVWQSQLGEREEVISAFVVGSRTYVTSTPIDGGGRSVTIRAVDVSAAGQGEVLWSVTQADVTQTGYFSLYEESIIMGFGPTEESDVASYLVALDQADGTELWRNTRSDALNWGQARVFDGGLYATGFGSANGSLLDSVLTRLDPDSGDIEWEYDLGGPVEGREIGEDRAYTLTRGGTVAAINDVPGSSGYGGEVWSETIGSGSDVGYALLFLSCGRLYTWTTQNPTVIYALSADDGSTLDTFTIEDGSVRSVVPAAGSLWVGSFFEPELEDDPVENYVYKVDDGSADPPAPEASVGLDPDTTSIGPDGEGSVGVLVEGAENGVGSYEMVLAVDDVGVASIADVSPTKNPASAQITIAGDGSSADVSVDMSSNEYEPGDVTVADLTLDAEGTGSTTLSLSNLTIRGTGDTTYDVTDVGGASVTVTDGTGPPPVVGDDPPQDLDGDGRYEDIDGNGEFTVADVQVFFQSRDSDVVQNNAEAFNFAGDDPPDVTVGDVQALFELFQEQS